MQGAGYGGGWGWGIGYKEREDRCVNVRCEESKVLGGVAVERGRSRRAGPIGAVGCEVPVDG